MKQVEKIDSAKVFRGGVFLCGVFLLAVLVFASSTAQNSTIKFERDKTGVRVPVGFTPRSILADTLYHYHHWFDRGYSGYKPDTTLTERLKEAFTDDIKLLVFYGTWCSDTRRELPRLMKILDTVGFPKERVKLCAVNRAKESGDDFAKKHGLKLVATVIIYKDGEEFGRIIETPKLSLESDMLQILKRLHNETQ